MLRALVISTVVLVSGAAWAQKITPCEQSCKEAVKACTDECIKRQPKAKHPDCKKGCGLAEQPCLDQCKKDK